MRAAATLLLTAAALFSADVHPTVARFCVGCHNAKVRTASVVLDGSAPGFDRGLWEEVLTKLKGAQMPPVGAPKPTDAERASLIKWVETELDKRSSQVDRDPGRVTVRRLNRTEYDNTVRDLLGVVTRPADDFPADDSGYGFDNIGDVLTVPPVLMEHYVRAAERISAAVIPLGAARKAALEKYVADVEEQSRRVDEDDPAGYPYPPGAFEAKHLFPVDAEYELVVRIKDRRNGTRNEVPVLLFLDGEQIATFSVQDGEYTKGHFSTRKFVRAGEHTLYGAFPKDYVNREEWDEARFGKAQFKVERRIFVDGLDVEGPYKYDSRQSPQWKRVFVCEERTDACAARIVTTLARRAYRREPTVQEIGQLTGLVKLAQRHGDSFEAGVQLALKAMLVSPQFLFRIERDPVNAAHPISPVELASRLSYFLWASMPDDTLLEIAIRGDLRDPAVLDSQVKRMLRDPKARALTTSFAGQWLQLRNVEKAQPDPALFPSFTPHLRESMIRETEEYFNYVAREDRNVLEFLDSNYSFLNARLAKHYGIDGVKGRELRKVDLATRDRGGVLTHASVLTVSSYPTRTSPVLRGLWVLENFLGAPPPPPPAGVQRLDEAKIGLDQPLRTQLEQHRTNPSCAVCHQRMDAIGLGLENFDPAGAWRTKDGKWAIDSSGELPGGKRFSGPAELKKVLLDDREAFVRTFTEKLLTFALGRGVERFDRPAVSAIVAESARQDYRFSSIVSGIVNSPPFRMRRAEGVTQ